MGLGLVLARRFGSGSGPLALYAEPESYARFGQVLNLEPERTFKFERVVCVLEGAVIRV
jgi:hypothetical protein